MTGKSIFLWLILTATASGLLYQTSYEVQAKTAELAELNRRIVAEQDAIQVLRAEWAHLNDPARIEQLARRFTLLQPTVAENLVTLDAIPATLPADMLAELMATTTVPVPARKPGRAGAAPSRPATLHPPPPARPAAPLPPAQATAPVILATYGAQP